MVLTRSQAKKQIIDFDEASKMWRKNKKHNGYGSFSYVCGEKTKKGTYCKNQPKKGYTACSKHLTDSHSCSLI